MAGDQRDTRKRRRNYWKGHLSEFLAACLLRAKGYRILARRYRARAGGEIDLIACKKRKLVFIEVKARANLEKALGALTAGQRKRITKAAEYWVSKNTYYHDYEINFDYIILLPWRIPIHYKDFFRE